MKQLKDYEYRFLDEQVLGLVKIEKERPWITVAVFASIVLVIAAWVLLS